MLNLKELFEKHSEEYLMSTDIENKLHERDDIGAFLLLSKLSNDDRKLNIVAYSVYDEITLSVSPSDVAMNATEQDILDLIRYGVMYDEYEDCFTMYV